MKYLNVTLPSLILTVVTAPSTVETIFQEIRSALSSPFRFCFGALLRLPMFVRSVLDLVRERVGVESY